MIIMFGHASLKISGTIGACSKRNVSGLIAGIAPAGELSWPVLGDSASMEIPPDAHRAQIDDIHHMMMNICIKPCKRAARHADLPDGGQLFGGRGKKRLVRAA
jgi:hypothetical protein